jgi:hypothetical protein
VQSERLDLPDIATTERMRVVAGYTSMLYLCMPIQRVKAILRQRIRRYGVAFVRISGGEITIGVEGDGNG